MAGAPEFQPDLPYTLAAASCCNSTHRFLCRRFRVSRNLPQLNTVASERKISLKSLYALIDMPSNQTEDAAAALTADTDQQPRVEVTDSGNIEEGRDAYQSGGFHPVFIGDVYADKYEVMSKIGYGRYSTVWLVKDLSKP